MNIKIANIVISKEAEHYLKNKNCNFINITDVLPSDEPQQYPTLIIGWDVASSYKDGDMSILDKTIQENLYWTFSPSERKMYFDDDVEQFISLSIQDYIKKVNYFSIDPIIESINDYSDFDTYINSNKIDSIYVDDTYLYFYSFTFRTIYGIDLKYYNEIGYNVDKLKDYLLSKCTNVLTEDFTSENSIIIKFKDYFGEDIPKKYIAYFNYFSK